MRYHPYRGHSALHYPVPEHLLPKRPISEEIRLEVKLARWEHVKQHYALSPSFLIENWPRSCWYCGGRQR